MNILNSFAKRKNEFFGYSEFISHSFYCSMVYMAAFWVAFCT